MKKNTTCIHAGSEPDPATGAIMTPIYQTSTFVQQSPGVHKGYEYARTHNPTRHALQIALAAIENGKYALCFASGSAAADAVVKLLNPGDEVIAANDMYGGTYRLFTKIFEKYGIKFHFINMLDANEVSKYINKNTQLIWTETPTNPMMNITDIAAVAAIAKKNNVLLCVDNTFASPYLQNPLDLGADIAVPGPQDCFLILRGLKTLAVRMQRHCENGEKIAHWLRNNPKVDKVYWCGFEDHPNHDIAKKQMSGYGGMMSFTLKDDSHEAAMKVLSSTKLFSLAESLGGVESLIGHPASMTHASIPREERLKNGLVDSLIRLSVGIEDADDLIEDLNKAIG